MHELIIASSFSLDMSNYLDLILPAKLEVSSFVNDVLRSSLADARVTNDRRATCVRTTYQ